MPQNFDGEQVGKVSKFLQEHMRTHDIDEMTADECAKLLAKNNILPNDFGPKPGFNFRQMLREGRDGAIPPVKGAYQERPHTRWHIYRVDD